MKRFLYYPLAVPLALGAQLNGHRVAWRSQCAVVDVAAKVLARQPFSLADQTYVLRGFSVVTRPGFEKVVAALPSLVAAGSGVLFVVNHFHRCPLGGPGNVVAFVHSLRYLAQPNVPAARAKDPYVAAAIGRFAAVSLVVQRLSTSCRALPVGRDTGGTAKILDLLAQGEWVVDYLEGRNSEALIRSSRGGGVVVYLAAVQGTPVIPAGLWFAGRQVFVDLGEPLDQQAILSLGRAGDEIDGQAVGDYAMREGIKPLLPERLWGDYAGAGPKTWPAEDRT